MGKQDKNTGKPSRPWQLSWWKENPERWRWAGTIAVIVALIGIFSWQNPQIWQTADTAEEEQGQQLAELDPVPEVPELSGELPEPTAEDWLALEDEEPGDQPLTDPDTEAEAEAAQPLNEVVSVTAAPQSWQVPLVGAVARNYGYGLDPTLNDYRFHSGVDIAVESNANVFAAADGTVVQASEDAQWTGIVIVEHGGGWRTIYKGLEPAVQEGDEVAAGDQIGTVSDSPPIEAAQAPHLHFEMELDGVGQSPTEWL